MIESIRNIDFFLSIIYFIIFLLITIKFSKKITDPFLKKSFIWFAVLKLIASQLYCYVYVYYYTYGDTIRFFRFGQMYKNLLFDINNLSFWEWFNLPNETFRELVLDQVTYSYGFAESSFVINKMSAIFSFFTFNSFLVNTMLFSLLSMTGIWKMFNTFYKLYPKLKIDLAISILFIPSVIFWGSGLMKDTICIGAIGWLIWAMYNIFFSPNKNLKKTLISLFVIYFSSSIIFDIKTYIIIALLSGAFIWILFRYRDKIKNKYLKASFTPLLIVFSILGIIIGLQLMSDQLEKYALENVVDTALALTNNLAKQDAGSTYDLGAIDPSLFGLIKKMPAAINVTLFRPYFWEVNSAIMIFSAIESFLLFLISLHIVIKVGIFKSIGSILNSGDIIFCFIFTIIFGFATGLSSSNFGSLVRYKIPIMPIYVTGIFILYYINTGQSYIDYVFNKKKINSKNK